MAQIAQYALDVSIKVDNIHITATVNDDKTTLYDGAADGLTAEQKKALVSLFATDDHDEADKADEATDEAETQLPHEATFVIAVLEHCSDDEDDDDAIKDDKEALATRGAPPMLGMPRGGFRGLWGGRGGMPGMMGRGGMGPGGMQGPGGMGPGGMGHGGMGLGGMGPSGMCFPDGSLGRQDLSGVPGPHGLDRPHGGPHGGPHGMPIGPGAPSGSARRMPGQWQYEGKSKHGLIALTVDIREI
ncbi:hypothetical protein AMAG_03151 [Allomyces macrogynus ATCC 38327]|uniref:Uncharacterized protein n=1 Tax=Allomyces macrogynus (strain ATCC 38327) TaxID=578462 RepID=A0A0L0S4J4_ALLM3|nr:hypothetical protein AMAG_03151 [Allomyces macrogynus ATCC 38327]|eukprot:KNE57437.1 hypothetical protein AMAG_03151 [Allomyces macrogynus ATCC 38327]